MKLASYRHNGKDSYGIYTPAGFIDLRSRLGQRYPDLKALLAGDGLAAAKALVDETPDVAESEVTFLPVIVNPGKILCVGMNYAAKRIEFDQVDPAPTLFVRFADSQTGHMTDVLKPQFSDEFDYEGELAVVIGRRGQNIAREDALSFVAGYSCYMDGSVRDWQHSWFTAGKNWPKTGAFGPYLTTSDEIPDPQVLNIHTYLNGSQVQDDNTRNMVHKVPELIEYISTFTSLAPGDVIITGSPGGVGKKRHPPLFMRPGDRIEVDIEHLGRLSNTIAEAKSRIDDVQPSSATTTH